VTFNAIPTKVGDPVAAHVQVSFIDGKELDASYSAALAPSQGCAPASPETLAEAIR